jgi:hypothetical protein
MADGGAALISDFPARRACGTIIRVVTCRALGMADRGTSVVTHIPPSVARRAFPSASIATTTLWMAFLHSCVTHQVPARCTVCTSPGVITVCALWVAQRHTSVVLGIPSHVTGRTITSCYVTGCALGMTIRNAALAVDCIA